MLYFAPHGHIQRHLALRHKHAPIDLQTDGVAQFNPVVLGIRAITFHRFTTGRGDICLCGQGDQAGKGDKTFHETGVAQQCLLTKPDAAATPKPMIPMDRLEQISQRFQFLEASMAAGADGADFAALAKE